MNLASLGAVVQAFTGMGEMSAEEQRTLYREVMLMTLSRATSTDANIAPVEVEKVREILCRVLDEDVSVADVRVAANSEIFETAPLEKYLARCGRRLTLAQRGTIARALSEVIHADERVTEREIEFFNMAAGALEVTAAELVGLTLS